MFVSPAYAQAAAAPGGGGLEAFIPLILIFVVFYFLLIRPQQKRMKQHKEMLSNVRRGDRVVTNGGIIGQIIRTQDEDLVVEIAENVRVKVRRSMLAEVIAKTEPVKGEKTAKAGKATSAEDAEVEAEEEEEAAAPEAKPAQKSEGLRGLLSGKDKK